MKSNLSVLLAFIHVFTTFAPGLAWAQEPRPGGPGQQPPQNPPANPTNPPVQPAVDPAAIQAAADRGTIDGRPGGEREGRERGRAEGQAFGFETSRSDGFERCRQIDSKRAFDEGYSFGYSQGQAQGRSDGEAAGRRDGDVAGTAQGGQDGSARADSDARVAATPVGTQLGVNQANQSDAPQQGTAAGTVAGDQAALTQARAADYPEGRAQYSTARYAEGALDAGSFSQKPTAEPVAPPPPQVRNDRPDYRYLPRTPAFRTGEEFDAYAGAAKAAYDSGFAASYGDTFRLAADAARDDGSRAGCEQAHRLNYNDDRGNGFNQGRNQGYADAFAAARDVAYRVQFEASRASASGVAYQANYQPFFDKYKELARVAAYKSRYQELFNAAFAAARDAKYAAIYPTYKAQQNQLGRDDEKADFLARPVKLVSAEVTETILNGVQEPGEPLRLKVALRNFSNQVVKGRDVRLVVEAVDSSGSTISIPQEILVQDLQPRSKTIVTDALELAMAENAVGTVKSFRVSVLNKDVPVPAGELHAQEVATVQVRTQWLASTFLSSLSPLREGLPGGVASFKITNASSDTPIAEGAKVTLAATRGVLDVEKPEVRLPAIGGSQSADVQYAVTYRANADSARIPFLATVSSSSGRRIGLYSTIREVSSENDYKIDESDLGGLRSAGVTRVKYQIRNISSRLASMSLQLKVTVLGDMASNYKVLGPNPQLIRPVEAGQSTTFTVPVISNAGGGHGTLQLEVQENGRTVVVRQTEF